MWQPNCSTCSVPFTYFLFRAAIAQVIGNEKTIEWEQDDDKLVDEPRQDDPLSENDNSDGLTFPGIQTGGSSKPKLSCAQKQSSK